MNAFVNKVLRTWPCLLPILFLTVVVGISYSNVYSNAFLWDDEFLIEENSYIKDFSQLDKIWTSSTTAGFGGKDKFFRPLQILAYTVAYQVSGTKTVIREGQPAERVRPWAFHLLNILLHLTTAVLFFFVVRKIWGSPRWALLSASLWAVHPIHTEAVTYKSATADPLHGLFMLLSFLLFLGFLEHRKKTSYLFAMISFILALFSKEPSIVLPGLLMIPLWLRPASRWRLKNYLVTLPFFTVAFAYLGFRKILAGLDSSFHFYKVSNIYTENVLYRIYTFLATLPDYVIMLFKPTHLHMERDFPVYVTFAAPVLLGLILLIVAAFALWSCRKHTRSPVTFMLLWFAIVFVPMCGIIIPVNAFILEHWLYVASLGFFVGFARIVDVGIQKSPRIAYSLFGLVLVTLMTLTVRQNQVWQSPIAFYKNVIRYGKGSARIYNNLAMAYADQEQWGVATEQYQKAIAISDAYPHPHYNLARIYIRQKNYDLAEKHLNRSLEIAPDFRFSKILQNSLRTYRQRMAQDPK